MEQPEGFEKKSDMGEKLVCKLQKSIYGLKQSRSAMLHTCLVGNGFTQNSADIFILSIYIYTQERNNEKVILIIGVDNLIIASNNESVMKNVKRTLTERFKMKDMGKLRHFLGIDFE